MRWEQGRAVIDAPIAVQDVRDDARAAAALIDLVERVYDEMSAY
jgi:hypothetical protein